MHSSRTVAAVGRERRGMARIKLFGGRESWINDQALRHPIDAARHRLGQPAFELRRRTNLAPPPPRVPFAPLEVDTSRDLLQSLRHGAVANAAAQAGRLRALRLLAKIEDFPPPTPACVSDTRNDRVPSPEHRYSTDEQIEEAIAALNSLNANQLTHAVRAAVTDALDTAHQKGERAFLPIGERHRAKSSMRAVLAALAEVHKRGGKAPPSETKKTISQHPPRVGPRWPNRRSLAVWSLRHRATAAPSPSLYLQGTKRSMCGRNGPPRARCW